MSQIYSQRHIDLCRLYHHCLRLCSRFGRTVLKGKPFLMVKGVKMPWFLEFLIFRYLRKFLAELRVYCHPCLPKNNPKTFDLWFLTYYLTVNENFMGKYTKKILLTLKVFCLNTIILKTKYLIMNLKKKINFLKVLF